MRVARFILAVSWLSGCGGPGGGQGSAGATTVTSAGATETAGGASEPTTGGATGADDTAAGSSGAGPTTGAAATRTIGGTVIGLQGDGLALVDGDGPPLAIAADGAFVFPASVVDGAAYAVTVSTQPTGPDQTCAVERGAGTVDGADVTDVAITCVTPIRHVVVIGIDGLGGNYVAALDTPVLDQMMAAGPHTLAMQNGLPTMSAPNWMSMIAGVSTDQHGVDSNAWSPGDSQPPPTIFAALRAQRPAAKIGVFHDWDGFGALVEPGVADAIESPGDEQQTTTAAIAWMQQHAPDLLFVHLDLVDHAGHFHGWGSQEYIDAVATAEALVAQISQAIDDAGMRPYTAVLVSADHGGQGINHGADTSLERPIPFLAVGPQVGPRTIDREVRIFDIAPTVAALLGIQPPPSWLGSPVVEALAWPPAAAEPTATLDVLAVDQYTWVYDDTGSGALTDVSIWRPVAPAGYVALGDVAVAGHDPPGFATLVVRDDPAALREPVGYEQIWNDKGSGGVHDVAIWSPIPPLGYTCLGSVARGDYDGPPANAWIRCVHRRYLVPGDRALVWTDAGSLAFQDAGLWMCVPGAAGGQAARSFVTRRHHSDPGSQRCWSIVPRGA